MLKKRLSDSGLRNYLRRVPNDSVIYYPGLKGGGSTAVDYSGQANHGTITGATWERLPSGIWVMHLDGANDYITVADVASIQDVSEWTISVWIYIDVWAHGDRIFEKTGNFRAYISDTNTVTSQRVYDTTPALSEAADNSISATSWYNITMTLTALDKTLRIYPNGVEAGSYETQTPGVGTLVTDAGDLFIGDRLAHDKKIDGKIGLLKFRTKPWSAVEVLDNFNEERRWFGK